MMRRTVRCVFHAACAWDTAWHNLQKRYQDRHPYLNELRRHATLAGGSWRAGVKTAAGWQLVYSLLWGANGYAADIDALMRLLCQGLDLLEHADEVELGLEHVRAASEGSSIIDAACLNSVGQPRSPVRVFLPAAGRDVAIEPGVLSALIAEIRLALRPVAGSLLDRADILDFPGGRALKGINGFGPEELNTGRLEHAIEVYKRGKLTFLFEQYTVDREVTALVLCSPGPTKPEAVQLQSQVESWLRIRHGGPVVPASETASPSLFMALTKFDMSLGALRSDNARDRWESRVQEACVDFWARGASSWLTNWGAKGEPFNNTFWIRNPYADQMRTLEPGEPDYEAVKQGYFGARSVQRHVKDAEAKWAAVEGKDDKGLPKSGVPLLTARLREKLAEDVKAKELAAEARGIRTELVALLRSLTPSKDEAEARERLLAHAKELVLGLKLEMNRRCSGEVFGEFMRLLAPPEGELEVEVRKAYAAAAPMSIKVSDKVKKVLTHVLRWWASEASARVRASELSLPGTLVDHFVREVCGSRRLLAVLGNGVFPYFQRSSVDTSLIARILAVKIGDGMLDLFAARERRVPTLPVKLSFSESFTRAGAAPASSEEAGAIDWGSVAFSETDDVAPPSVEIVFAGSGHFRHWSSELANFYLGNAGARAQVSDTDPRVQKLLGVLSQVERIHVGTDA